VVDPSLNSPPGPAPLVSVCVANYNGADVIETCLASLYAQEPSVSIEVLVHDDASTDGSAAIISSHYPQVLLITSGENVGFCVANNRMVKRASGTYILLLNNDAWLAPNALATFLQAATREGSAQRR